MRYQLEVYEAANGKRPFTEWLNGLKDRSGRIAIRMRLERLELGNFGKCRSLAEGVHELKIDLAGGYRVYFGMRGKICILLLCGGNKRTQESDIKKAKEYFADYKKRKD